jgi:hypothetical protein
VDRKRWCGLSNTTANTKSIGNNLGEMHVKTGSNTPRCTAVEMTMRYLYFFVSEEKKHAGYADVPQRKYNSSLGYSILTALFRSYGYFLTVSKD